jgi:phenylalanine-4-hydroxylase
MRHPSVPLYTPEPDVVHEYVGHVPTLAHPAFVELNVAFGEAATHARGASAQIEALIRLYWYTLEFGLVAERGEIKVQGAGILSSYGELGRFHDAELREFDIDEIERTPYDPTAYQKQFFVAPDFERFRGDLLRRLGT